MSITITTSKFVLRRLCFIFAFFWWSGLYLLITNSIQDEKQMTSNKSHASCQTVVCLYLIQFILSFAYHLN